MNISTHEITNHAAAVLLDTLPPPRCQVYRNLAGSRGDIGAAELYLWNSYVASAVQRTTGMVEILLRNAIDSAFSQWNIAHGGPCSWITDPVDKLAEIVTPPGKKPLSDWADLCTVNGNPTHHDYVAGLSFGSWTQLLPRHWHQNASNPRRVLWVEALAPNLHNADMTNFSNRSRDLQVIRNRASHHRPLINAIPRLEKAHQDCIEIAKNINPQMGEWLRQEQWILNAVRKSPI